VVAVVTDPTLHDAARNRDWVARWHGTARAVDTVAAVYADVVAAR
jgi:hypothetical protein